MNQGRKERLGLKIKMTYNLCREIMLCSNNHMMNTHFKSKTAFHSSAVSTSCWRTAVVYGDVEVKRGQSRLDAADVFIKAMHYLPA